MSVYSDNTVIDLSGALMLHKYFEELGFSDKEEKVYLVLAELGKATASAISKRTSIPRATVYTVLDDLVKKGVVSQEQTRGSSLFVVNNPSAFVRLIEQQREELDKKTKTAADLVTLLAPYLKSTGFSVPKLQFFEGKHNVETMLYDYLTEWRESYARTEDYTLWGYQDNTVVEEYRKWHEHFWKTKSPQEHIRLYSNTSDLEKELRQKISNREVRPLPAGTQFSSSIWIYGEYIIMLATRQKPHYAYHLKDVVLASNLRAIFQLLWNAKLG